jgi:hypothetical protein
MAVNGAIIGQIKDLPRWTQEELGYLMQLCRQDRTWEKRVEVLDHLFGRDHEPGFFTIKGCQEKYKRLNGESQGKPVDEELHKWMEEYLQKSLAETCGNPELAKMVKTRRLYEFCKHVADERFTADQMVELSGIESTIDYLTGKVVKPGTEDREHWLNADLMNSKISRDDWKSFRCINDLIRKIREVQENPADESNLVFNHAIDQEPEEPIEIRIQSPHKPMLLAVHSIICRSPCADISKNPDRRPGYSKIVKKPIDLETIGKMIKEDEIVDFSQLSQIYLLMCTNLIVCVPEGYVVNEDARRLQTVCEETIQNYVSSAPRRRSSSIRKSLYR